ncbi:MAG TPA: hypothetical protein VGB74_09810 [Actinoplanes sp.]
MPSEDQPAESYAARMAFATRKDHAAAARRTRVRMRILLVTLVWAVSVPLLVAVGLLGAPGAFTLAAVLTVMGPFVAAVIATRNQRFGAGAAYTVLTLLMVVPALAIAHQGG